jgi:prevent-host-death family protein
MANWTVADAKARFSEVIEKARREGPQTVTRNGKDAVVIVATEEWNAKAARRGSLAEFLLGSPLRGSGLDLDRLQDGPRDVGP